MLLMIAQHPSTTFVSSGFTHPVCEGVGYSPMPTNQDIRRANLATLLEECAQELGDTRGAAAELARRTGVAAPMISQTLNQKPHHGGAARKIGDKTARRLERGMNKEQGWLDIDHGPAVLSAGEHAMLATYRALTPEQRDVLMLTAAEYARLNRSADIDVLQADPAPITRQ